MTDDLVQFLRDRLDEDERVAREAGTRSLQWRLAVPLDDAELGDASWLRPPELKHAERHDPARVLADVEAKRQLLDLHPITTLRQQHGEADLVSGYGPNYERRLKRPDESYCETCDVYDGLIDGDGTPCPTLRLLALPFAGHPDYREDWRP